LIQGHESYVPAAEGRAKIDSLLSTFYSLLEDLMFAFGDGRKLVRNTDILGELKKMSENATIRWVEGARKLGAGEERALRPNCWLATRSMTFATALEARLMRSEYCAKSGCGSQHPKGSV